MSDTPRTDRDDRTYPLPEHAQRIQFEGCECVVMSPEDYESLYEHARQLERELATENQRIKELEEALGSIREYWNRDNNKNAMQDACWHAVNTAAETLEKGTK